MMRDTRFKALKCDISRGGFSDERVFRISIGDHEYTGVASRQYFWTEAGEDLQEGEPPAGQVIAGLIATKIIEVQDDNRVLVSVPDGEVITVPVDALRDRPSSKVGANVPVGS
jgi:hypothetical protein